MAAIELERLERRYGERVALGGVSVRVEEGQTLAVLGGNGAGKTTLLRVLAGLLRPHGGSARVLGAALPGERWKLPAQVGYLGHEPLLYRELTGRENLRYHAACTACPHSRVDDCSPPSASTTAPTSRCAISRKGLVQRLAVARAVLHEPRAAPARRAAREPRPRRGRAARAAHRPGVGAHAGAREPRRGGRAGGVRRRARARGRAAPAPVDAELYR